jgi:PAS domain S-box-containing protein
MAFSFRTAPDSPEAAGAAPGGSDLRSVAQLRMLHSLAQRLNRLGDVQQIGEAITSELRTLIDYHNCRVHLISDDGETLIPIAFHGHLTEYQGETYEALLIPVGTGITGTVARTGLSYYAPNTADDETAVTIPGTPDVDESLMVVPMRYGDSVVGTVALAKLGIDRFDAGDLRILEVLASHAAVAVQNARLLEREREAATRARESEARKSAIVESALDCIVVMDEQGRITEFNPAAERAFGYARSEVVGREVADVMIPPEVRGRYREGLARYLRNGQSDVLDRRLEMTAMRADGTEFPVELAIARVHMGGPAMFTGYIRDITDRRRAELEIARALETERQAGQQLRELDELKNMFLEAVSHDLRTPLSAVLGFALTLEREDVELTPDVRRDMAGRLAANARKLDRILCNLLDLDRLIRGVVEPNLELARVDTLVRRVVGEADFLSGRTVTIDAPPIEARVDVAKVERVVENLLVNAGKHATSSSRVCVRVLMEDRFVVIVVEDDGPGIEPALRERIFEPFRQGTQHASPGTGIGLSLVARFAELHGGRAWVEAREEGGASFRVALPIEPVDANDPTERADPG